MKSTREKSFNLYPSSSKREECWVSQWKGLYFYTMSSKSKWKWKWKWQRQSVHSNLFLTKHNEGSFIITSLFSRSPICLYSAVVSGTARNSQDVFTWLVFTFYLVTMLAAAHIALILQTILSQQAAFILDFSTQTRTRRIRRREKRVGVEIWYLW